MPTKKHAPKKMVTFTVSFPLPPGATVTDAHEYVKDAVTTWRGQCRPPGAYNNSDPGDPMFRLDRIAVHVTRQRAHIK